MPKPHITEFLNRPLREIHHIIKTYPQKCALSLLKNDRGTVVDYLSQIIDRNGEYLSYKSLKSMSPEEAEELLTNYDQALKENFNKAKKRPEGLFAREFTRAMINGKVCYVHEPPCNKTSLRHRKRLDKLFTQKAQEYGETIAFDKKEIDEKIYIITDESGYRVWQQLAKKHEKERKGIPLKKRKFIPVFHCYAYFLPEKYNNNKKIVSLLWTFRNFAKRHEKTISFNTGQLFNEGKVRKCIYLTPEDYKKWLILLSAAPSQNESIKTIKELEQELYGEESAYDEEASDQLAYSEETEQSFASDSIINTPSAFTDSLNKDIFPQTASSWQEQQLTNNPWPTLHLEVSQPVYHPQPLQPHFSLEESIDNVKQLPLFARKFTPELINGKVWYVYEVPSNEEFLSYNLLALYNYIVQQFGEKGILFELKKNAKTFSIIIDEPGYKKWQQLPLKHTIQGKLIYLSELRFVPILQLFAYPIPSSFSESEADLLLRKFREAAKIKGKEISFEIWNLIINREKGRYIYLSREEYKAWLILLSIDLWPNASTKTIAGLEQELYGEEGSGPVYHPQETFKKNIESIPFNAENLLSKSGSLSIEELERELLAEELSYKESALIEPTGEIQPNSTSSERSMDAPPGLPVCLKTVSSTFLTYSMPKAIEGLNTITPYPVAYNSTSLANAVTLTVYRPDLGSQTVANCARNPYSYFPQVNSSLDPLAEAQRRAAKRIKITP